MSMHEKDFCPVTATAELIGSKWTLRIIHQLMERQKRFCELQEDLGGVNPSTLSQRLKLLESEGVVTRTQVSDTPPWVEYQLTEKGKALSLVIASVAEWGRRWLDPVTVAYPEKEKIQA
jgi:DNA-binding HxlR family transcriptional regulator